MSTEDLELGVLQFGEATSRLDAHNSTRPSLLDALGNKLDAKFGAGGKGFLRLRTALVVPHLRLRLIYHTSRDRHTSLSLSELQARGTQGGLDGVARFRSMDTAR